MASDDAFREMDYEDGDDARERLAEAVQAERPVTGDADHEEAPDQDICPTCDGELGLNPDCATCESDYWSWHVPT